MSLLLPAADIDGIPAAPTGVPHRAPGPVAKRPASVRPRRLVPRLPTAWSRYMQEVIRGVRIGIPTRLAPFVLIDL